VNSFGDQRIRTHNYFYTISRHAEIYYAGPDIDDDHLDETRIIKFLNRNGAENCVKLVDPEGILKCPPIDACCTRFVYEFKMVPARLRGGFKDFDSTSSRGAFVDEFKLDNLRFACGRNMCRFPRGSHFEEGFYVYGDRMGNTYALSVTAIREFIDTHNLKRRKWENREGWMIPTGLWWHWGVANNPRPDLFKIFPAKADGGLCTEQVVARI